MGKEEKQTLYIINIFITDGKSYQSIEKYLEGFLINILETYLIIFRIMWNEKISLLRKL